MKQLNSKKKQRASTIENKSLMIMAMKVELGNVYAASKLAGISRAQHYRWLKNDEQYEYIIWNLKESILDFAEAALMKNIALGDTKSIIYFLNARGQSRGYGKHGKISSPPFKTVNNLSKLLEKDILLLMQKSIDKSENKCLI